jgi:hypothetical protein
MLVFIDESGDAGFMVGHGSSPVFVAAMVIFEDSAAAAATQAAIAGSEARRVHKGEFKFSKTREDLRDLFFQAVRGGPFTVRAIVVKKDEIHFPDLKTDKETFYEFFVKQMILHDNNRLANAKVVIDGSGDRVFRKNLSAALRKRMREGAVKSCKFSDSKNDVLVQLADMCVGAIARSFHEGRANQWRWRNMLDAQIEDVWTFR